MAKRKSLTKKVRFEVFKRDSFTCQYCGAEAPNAVLHVDHVLPVKEGGDNEITNLVTACAACNMGKGARKLNDDSALARQKQQLNELNERREQIELLQQWRAGMADLHVQEVEQVCDHMESMIAPFSLGAESRRKIGRIVKKHGLQKTLDGMEAACDYRLKYEDDLPTQESVSLAIAAITKSIKWLCEPEHKRKFMYINGIARNRVYIGVRDQEYFKDAIAHAYECGVSLEAIEGAAKRICTKGDFYELLEELEGAKGAESQEH